MERSGTPTLVATQPHAGTRSKGKSVTELVGRAHHALAASPPLAMSLAWGLSKNMRGACGETGGRH